MYDAATSVIYFGDAGTLGTSRYQLPDLVLIRVLFFCVPLC